MDTTKQQRQKASLTVYDPAMCCSTGVCGPDIDNKLVDFSNDVKWLKSQGVKVQRYNLGQEPEAFKSNPEVISRLRNKGSDILPILTIDGSIISKGEYPSRDQLTKWLEIKTDQDASSSNEKVIELLEQSVIDGDLDKIRNQFRLAGNSVIPKKRTG